ncbi:rhodanese-like domain-containing protein [Buchnera aphidicola (Hyperomyzus lactucae)]|uniref:Rhodanese-like domain-containing protein n=1 Tax=Buchnera aphidicola (Hyperomyzus lactucae) TaxID=1241860 RepID=A0A4D6XXY9_9GAMM|nr:rhodanese-like domain-containing protein [Buchnera aphidicola]QCI20799.1 rhodanese-like domain-containing protein [Buchnera aphidicola (Hyperomyzus lactucae)]
MRDVMLFISENIILFIIWFFFLVLAIFLSIRNIFIKSKIINNIQAIKLINQHRAIIIDTRSSDFFNKGHIVNSINFPLNKIFLSNFKEIEIYKSSPIILILNETYKYNKCIQAFLKYGFNHIYILNNGIHSWNLEYLPLVTKEKKS